MEIIDSLASFDLVDWRSLDDGQWLTSGAIDACVKLYYNNVLKMEAGMKSKFLYVNASLSSAVLSGPDNVEYECPLLKCTFKDKILFFPFNIDNTHWVLFVCDFSSKTITYCGII